ncbi:MAG: hypothetical protein WB586_29715, partial [Chthoniobacterales bacterium]
PQPAPSAQQSSFLPFKILLRHTSGTSGNCRHETFVTADIPLSGGWRYRQAASETTARPY